MAEAVSNNAIMVVYRSYYITHNNNNNNTTITALLIYKLYYSFYYTIKAIVYAFQVFYQRKKWRNYTYSSHCDTANINTNHIP